MSFRQAQWVFPVAVLVHNGEEAITMPAWVEAHGAGLPVHPAAGLIWAALLVLTLAAGAVTFWSVRGGKESRGAYVLFGGVAAMLINVVVPHVPAAIVLRGYAPGVGTAVLINLPLMTWLMIGAVREGWVCGRKALAAAVLVPLSIGVAIAAVFVLA